MLSVAVETSTPEERIAHRERYKAPDGRSLWTYTFTCKRQSERQWSSGSLRQRRVQTSRQSSALSPLAKKLWKTEAPCAVMAVVCSLREDAETQRGFQKLKQACADSRGTVMGTSKARRPLKLGQMQAEGRDHWLIQTFPRWSFMQPWPLRPLQFVHPVARD